MQKACRKQAFGFFDYYSQRTNPGSVRKKKKKLVSSANIGIIFAG